MRVTRESLIRIAKETAQQRAFNDPDIIAAYLTGALVSDTDPLLGGTADIDVIFVHASEPKHRREFVKLTPDFHMDISHRARAEFKRPRELRLDPWLGWEMYDPLLLYEREKFFEFIQAGLRAGFEFNAPAPALQRSRILLSHARQIWRDLLSDQRYGHTEGCSAVYEVTVSRGQCCGGTLGPSVAGTPSNAGLRRESRNSATSGNERSIK